MTNGFIAVFILPLAVHVAHVFTIDAAQMMTWEPKTVRAGMRFAEAEAKMRDNKINAVVVTDEEGSVAGVLQIYDFAEGEAELQPAS